MKDLFEVDPVVLTFQCYFVGVGVRAKEVPFGRQHYGLFHEELIVGQIQLDQETHQQLLVGLWLEHMQAALVLFDAVHGGAYQHQGMEH